MSEPTGRRVQIIINLPCPVPLVVAVCTAMEKQYPTAIAQMEDGRMLLIVEEPPPAEAGSTNEGNTS